MPILIDQAIHEAQVIALVEQKVVMEAPSGLSELTHK